MSKVYKIHPGMGFARVGPSVSGFFLTTETLGASPVDIDSAGNEAPFGGYKDSAKLMRRQGARFRIYEYDRNDVSGELKVVREVTSNDANVQWTVVLTAAKAAGPQMVSTTGSDGKRTIVPSASSRNDPPTGFTRSDLSATVKLFVGGPNAGPAPGAEPTGRIVGKNLFIGEARTDSAGRLIVLAGRGHSASWATPPRPMMEYLNNPTWYDDISDGSVDAVLTFPGQGPITAQGAWAFTAPPDFAPDIYPLTSLLDIAEQAAGVPLPASLTFPQDVEPILMRASNIFFVNGKPGWKTVHDLVQSTPNLGLNSQAAKAGRVNVKNAILNAAERMSDYTLTTRQQQILQKWADGSFQGQADSARPPLSPPASLDRTSLDHCIGGGFFPGIEAGTVLRQPSIYSELGRITRGTFTDYDGTNYHMVPGLMSSRMACPWQADFTECAGSWWPAQRPDIVGRNVAGTPLDAWDRGIIIGQTTDPRSHQNMVDHFAQLGVVVRSGNGFAEVDRDPALPTGG